MKMKLLSVLVACLMNLNSAFAAQVIVPESISCNLSGNGLVCQTMPVGMIVLGNTTPSRAGVYTYARNATITSDGIFMASYKLVDGSTTAMATVGNHYLSKYRVDVKKTEITNPNWKFNKYIDEYECKAKVDDCAVELMY